MSATVDMPLQEYQEILANSMELENLRAVRIMKSYYGSKPSMFFMGSDGKVEHPDYTPDTTFETTFSNVNYPMPGTDINSMTVSIGQLVGTGIMSTETARILSPAIKDPQIEEDRVVLEGLRKSLLTGLEQQAAQGQLDPSIIARIAKLKAQSHMTLEDAVDKIHQEMQEEQAAKAQQQQQQQQPGQAPGPEMQPGMGVSPENPIQGGGAPAGKPSLQDLLGQLGGGGAPPAPGAPGAPVAQAPAPAPAGV